MAAIFQASGGEYVGEDEQYCGITGLTKINAHEAGRCEHPACTI
jgi:hypothetical protein